MEPLKLLVYGPPGHGKTTLIGSGVGDPRVWPMILFDFEGGTSSIESKCRTVKLSEAGSPVEGKIDVVRVKTWDDLVSAIEYLGKGEHPYHSVAVDSLSEIGYLSLEESIVAGTTIAKAAGREHDPDVPEQSDYQRNMFRIKRLVRYFRDLPVHVIFTATSQVYEGRSTVNLPGKLPGEVTGLVQIVAYLGVQSPQTVPGQPSGPKPVKRVLITTPSARLEVKARVEGGKLRGELEDPTLPLILDQLETEAPEQGVVRTNVPRVGQKPAAARRS